MADSLFCLIICRQNIFRLLVAYSIFLCLSVLPGNYYLVMLGEGIANAKLCFFYFLKNNDRFVFQNILGSKIQLQVAVQKLMVK